MTQLDEPRTMLWTLDGYHRAVEAGIFDGRRVQLLDGEIIEMAAQKNDHAFTITKCDYTIRRGFGDGFTIRIQLPMTIVPHGEPEPDLAILEGSPDKHPTHPTFALLVIEVSDTTLSMDRERKGIIYACAGIPDYWIINLVDRIVEVYRKPLQDRATKSWRFSEMRTYSIEETVTPISAPNFHVAVKDLLP